MADQVIRRIVPEKEKFQREFSTPGQINSFVVDDLLDPKLAREIYETFPKKEEMRFRNTMRERKYVTSQMNKFNPILEEAVYAFQDLRLVVLLSEITQIKDLYADEKLYAGGISLMSKDCFLNPHIDNSHDYDGKRYRVLNSLYYVSPDWKEGFGGNLELWDHGVKKPGRTIASKFNRLVVMSTFRSSWHSVSKLCRDASRCCVSNYYFSPHSVEGKEYYHVTSFRGRPEELFKDMVLVTDLIARNIIGKMLRVFIKGNIKTFHVYGKK